MKRQLPPMTTAGSCTVELRANPPHGEQVITITIVPQKNKPPKLSIVNTTNGIRRYPRCIRVSSIDNFARVYHYDDSCIGTHDGWHYELAVHLVATSHRPIPKLEQYLTDTDTDTLTEPHDNEHWTLHAQLRMARVIPLCESDTP